MYHVVCGPGYQLSPDCVYIRAYSRDEKKALFRCLPRAAHYFNDSVEAFKEGAASTTASVSVPAPPEKKGKSWPCHRAIEVFFLGM